MLYFTYQWGLELFIKELLLTYVGFLLDKSGGNIVKSIEFVVCSDADGILNDLTAFIDWVIDNEYPSEMPLKEEYKNYLRYLLQKKKHRKRPEIINPVEYGIAKRYGVHKLTELVLRLKYIEEYFNVYPPREGAFETLKNAQDLGGTVKILTARVFTMNILPQIRQIARDSFEQWVHTFGSANDIALTGEDIYYFKENKSGLRKSEVCNELNADFLIDDKPENIDRALDHSCDVIAIETEYNKWYQPKDKKYNFFRVKNWEQINQIFENYVHGGHDPSNLSLIGYTEGIIKPQILRLEKDMKIAM